MHRRKLLAGCSLLVLTAALTWYWQRTPATIATPDAANTLSAPAAEAAPITPSQVPAPSAEQLKLLNSPQAKQQQHRLAFHNRYRNLVDHASTLDAATRQAESESLAKGIDELERQGELALSEALLLQLGLIKATTTDEAQQKAQAEVLIKRYRAISAQREKRLAQQRDPDFERYKVEEKRIVEEVLALQTIPDGLTRDQYLRQRLQQARERNYP